MPWGRSPGNDASKSNTSTDEPPDKPPQTTRAAVRARDTGGRREMDKKSWDYIVRSGVAGGVAGCAAKTVVGPLDRVKILFQASNPQFAKYTGSWFGAVTAMRDIYKGDGARGLFRGHSATLLRVFPYAGIKFLAYEQIRARMIPSREYETPLRRFLSGSMAGMTSVFFTYPLEVIRVRMAFETKRQGKSSLSSTVNTIYNERPAPPTSAVRGAGAVAATVEAASQTMQSVTPRSGLANFFRGFTATLCGMLPYAGASFLTHDTASDLLQHPMIAEYTTKAGTAGSLYNCNANGQTTTSQPAATLSTRRTLAGDAHKPPQLKAWAELTCGGMAGFVSQTVSYPLEVVRRRMQVGGVVGDGRRLGMAEVATSIMREKGWRGFFVGLGIGYVKVIPMAATAFLVYERMKYLLGI